MQLFTFSQRVTYLEDSIIWKPDNIARIGFINRTLTLSHELSRRRETDYLALTHMQIGLIADKLARADLAECNTTAVIGVDIGSNLENKASEFRFCRLNHSLFGLSWFRAWSNINETIQ